jgi:hypothetical protein
MSPLTRLIAAVAMACPVVLAGAVLLQIDDPTPTPLRAEGSEWVVTLQDGSRLRSRDLIGAELQLEGGTVLRLDAAEQLGEPVGRRWWAHELSVRQPGGNWQPLCPPHSDGTHYAVVLPGRQLADGSLADDPAAYAISCTTGALAKCLRFGYRPWHDQFASSPKAATARATFNACVRMVRADYGGRGEATTENGHLIDVYDDQGIQRADRLADQTFEAGWDEYGAVCVHHPRVAAHVTLAALEQANPRLRGKVGEACTEARARELGARVFNRSAPAVARALEPDESSQARQTEPASGRP